MCALTTNLSKLPSVTTYISIKPRGSSTITEMAPKAVFGASNDKSEAVKRVI